ncbi:MAG: carboxypeptidase-like regulatory domain-containing protein [Bacteroidia bacterium]|nr:carboxypeptidase-like regulatory domain-containing protein [Bacteroidia bacterium]NNK26614.1 carboxypeptidase-like regulatory domain-containing protein [Flavobacteriaceae bacterium]
MKNEVFINLSKIISLVLLVILSSLVPFNAYSQENQDFTEYKGEVIDDETNKPLVFADLNVDGTNISTVTNTEGDFALKVPDNLSDATVTISFLGYKKKSIPLSNLRDRKNTISLSPSITKLTEVSINVPKNAETLVKAMLKKKGENYITEQTIMTAFYRETIKKRRKNASLSEAVVEIYKQPYDSRRDDAIKLIKARKSTNYSRLDTVALKLQGGPFSALYADMIKYPKFIFNEDNMSDYIFTFGKSTEVNNRPVYVVNFKQHPTDPYPLYYGKLFIDAETFALTSAVYNLNVSDRVLAGQMFIRKKPRNAIVYPTEAAYRVDYRTNNGKWYYGYSNIQLTFKVNWKNKLFNSVYSLQSEMAITDWEANTTGLKRPKQALRPTVILADEAAGFSEPEFWGKYNIIEPEKSIENAIRKINRQFKRSQTQAAAN